ncbi:agmatinase [bacterium (Candidatus Blackallbacteria) CG17_big_fil_post_rev_8_21_14_2_50_48_46]|uniref:Agmatinase n=1 Tax=bacterium (Candidatus Blackallbacteria) CG17_big_fil_post_rev_8_21_14_2_50_48_46 TaxID=2014261 RepID=A0A2M7G3N1_9BACT|nr:MAG: agmatinase [bacterium (Candidatus Blackallbacteria) CG18_big_fil_WC_8_21_14_2_50_49_26]PIW16331.1 MAG: agmatinase [bacterium (Candidatus Blackallbacteria) CG17_big_fil_post_rev_8_21_14_2_50_48_46]PIW45345.1 MAG: agmatinase [bacterium (Candidatus Blackallbacteria) CG13_big_fil_rev_8_21_14_2_50_49_14]
MAPVFGGLEAEYCQYATSRYAVLPVPYDQTSTWLRGAEKGPDAILEASAHMELYDLETDSEPYRAGIFTDAPLICKDSPDLLFEKVLARANRLLDDGKFLITLGGNHCVPIGSSKACCERVQGPVSVLQIDAHSDMRESYEGNAYNHACAMARMKEWARPVGVGIRSMDISELENIRQARIFTAAYIHRTPGWIQEVVDALDENVYLTIDLDGLDPSIMPATGTPEPGGLLWYPTLDLLAAVIQQKNLIGFDIVELCPGENTFPSHFLAAKLVYKIIALQESKGK